MARAKDVQGEQMLLGRGKVYFDRFEAAGAHTGEQFLGNCTQFEVTPQDTIAQKFSSATKDSPLVAETNTRRVQSFNLVLDEFDPENVAMALMGEVVAFTQSSGGPVADELVPALPVTGVKQGRYYQLGGYLTPRRSVTGVVVTSNPAGTTYTVDVDYEVDAVCGRIYIVPGGAIADGTDVLVDYSYSAITGKVKVVAGTSSFIEGFLRFVADPADGPLTELQVWKLRIRNNGAVGFIQDEYGNMTFTGNVVDDSVNHPTEPYYRVLYP